VSSFCVFLKTTPYDILFKIMFRKFSPPHWSTLLCSNVVKFVRGEIGKSCVTRMTKKNKILTPSQTVATARIAPKICQGQPTAFGSHCSRFHLNRFTFGGVTAERVKAVLLPHRVFPWLASNTFEANNKSELYIVFVFLASVSLIWANGLTNMHYYLTTPQW